MSEPASISTGIAGRYASAVYELATETKATAAIESDIAALTEAMAESADLNALLQSPIYSRDEQQAAVTAIAAKMGLSDVMANTLSLMASKRRLFVVPQLVQALRDVRAS